MTSKLKEARQNAGYTVEQVADILKIRKQYIIGIEEEDFDQIPGKIYVEGYVKLYSEFLGIQVIDNLGDDLLVRQRDSLTDKNGKVQWMVLIFSFIMLIAVLVSYYLMQVA